MPVAAPAPAEDAPPPAPEPPPAEADRTPAPDEVAGRVVTPAGHPVAAARVRLVRLSTAGGDGPPPDAGRRASALSGADGSFRFAGSPAGFWELRAEHPEQGEGSLVLRNPLPRVAVVVVAPPLALPVEGVVRSADGAPIHAAEVTVRVAGLGPFGGAALRTRTDARGAFRLTVPGPGPWDVTAAPAVEEGAVFGARGDGLPSDPVEVTAPAAGLEIVLRAGESVEGRCVDETGAPLAGVVLSLLHASREGSHPTAHARTGVDGRFRLEGLAPGPHVLFAAPAADRDGTSRPGAERRLALPAGDAVEVVLPRGLAVEGVIRLENGDPLPGGVLRAMPLHGAPTEPTFWRTGAVDGAGRFRVTGLPPGTYALHLVCVGEAPPPGPFDNGVRDPAPALRGGSPVAAGTRGLVLVVEDGAGIEGVLVDEGGRPLAGGEVTLQDPLTGDRIGFPSDGEGRFRAAGLEAGRRYDLDAIVWGRGAVRREGVTAGGPPLVLEIGLGLHASGRVVDAVGRPVPSTSFLLVPADGDHMATRWVRIEEDGSWIAGGLEDRTYRAVLDLWGADERGRTLVLGEVRPGDEGLVLVAAP